MACQDKYLLIEPFNSGSHKQLIDVLLQHIPGTHAITLPGKKWQWKARTSALYLSQIIPYDTNYRSVFVSSVLNLAELVALRPDLAPLHKVVYFHENQLQYPVRKHVDTDFQYGYNQILTCLVADTVLFNSAHNMESFLGNIGTFLKLIPYERPKNIAQQLRPKCRVLHFPIEFPEKPSCVGDSKNTGDNNEDPSYVGGLKNSRVYSEKPVCVSGSENSRANSDEMEGSDDHCDSMERVTDVVEGLKHEHLDTHSQDNGDKADDSAVDVDSVCTSIGVTSVVPDASTDRTASDTRGGSACLGCIGGTSDNTSGIGHQAGSGLCEPGTEAKRLKYSGGDKPLHIVWPHRWEHDKGPEAFFQVMFRLQEAGLKFRLSVLGEDFLEKPGILEEASVRLQGVIENWGFLPSRDDYYTVLYCIFEEASVRLQGLIENWGFLPSRDDYYTVLSEADCVVSTANHEFFGVAMLEAVHLGCYPLCPNRLVYPEIFPKEYLYNTDTQLFKRLREFCRRPHLARQHSCKVDTSRYEWEALQVEYTRHITQTNPQHG